MGSVDAEVDRLRALLKARVTRHHSLRGLERELGFRVRAVLQGETTLTLAHVLDLLRAGGISPEDFFVAAYPDAQSQMSEPLDRPGTAAAAEAALRRPLGETEEQSLSGESPRGEKEDSVSPGRVKGKRRKQASA